MAIVNPKFSSGDKWRSLLAASASIVLVGSACASGTDNADPDGQVSTTTSIPADLAPNSTMAVTDTDCSIDTPTVESEEFKLTVDGEERIFLVTAPPSEGKVRPVVFDFHGLAEGPVVHAQMSKYGELALEDGFVAVMPAGRGDPIAWDITATEANQDLTFFDSMLETLTETQCVDPSRVYSTGLSNGAMFTSLLMCERSTVVAAAAPVAGITQMNACEPERSVPFQSYHGTADPILLFNGGVDRTALDPILGSDGSGEVQEPVFDEVPPGQDPTVELDGSGYPETVRYFAEIHGCEDSPMDQDVSDEVILRTYDCPTGADAEFYIIQGGGHSWPGSDFSATIESVVGYTTFDIDATELSWSFMSQFALPTQ